MDTSRKADAVAKTEAEILAAKSNWDAYVRARDAGHTDYIARAAKQNSFYLGEQWTAEDLAKLKKEGRPALTINQIFSNVNTVRGEHVSQRAEVTFRPKRDATDAQATVLSKVVTHILSGNKYEYLEADMFADGIIEDRGYIDCRMDFTDNLLGEVRLSLEDPTEILPDPDARDYDPRTWNEFVRTRWVTLDDIELMYGKDKADALRHSTTDSYGIDSIVRNGERSYGDTQSTSAQSTNDASAIKRVRVIERQYRKLDKQAVFVDTTTGDMRPIAENMPPERAAAIAQAFNLTIVKRLVRRVRWTITADQTVLHDKWSPYKNFTIVPFFPVFRRGKTLGMVAPLLSPQEQLNKVESQQLHIINASANGGWKVPVGSLVNMTVDELKTSGAETGLILEYNEKNGEPTKIEANTVPTGLDRMGEKALNNIREIGGTASLLGIDGPSVSGVRLERSQQRGIAQLQPMFQNLNRSRGILAELILDMVQAYYTETRVMQITNWEGIEPQNEELTVNGMTPEGQVVNDLRLGEYSVVVATQPARDTFQDTQFAEALQLREAGVVIPDHHVILNSHLANKREIAAEAQKLAGLAPPTEQEAAIQEFMLQQNLAMMEGGVRELNATIANLEAQAQLAQAKAATMVGEAEQAAQAAEFDRAMEMQKEITKLREFSANLTNKLQLAGIHSAAKRELTMFTGAVKRADTGVKVRADMAKTGLKVAADIQKARISAASKPPASAQ